MMKKRLLRMILLVALVEMVEKHDVEWIWRVNKRSMDLESNCSYFGDSVKWRVGWQGWDLGLSFGLEAIEFEISVLVLRGTADAVKSVETKGFNLGLIVLLIIGGLLFVFLVGNYVLYIYAQKTLPPKKKKSVSKKKIKRERIKQGVSALGE
ncbi:hypothetical protein Droror1_Dr00016293 [Drosera rotundifolia]